MYLKHMMEYRFPEARGLEGGLGDPPQDDTSGGSAEDDPPGTGGGGLDDIMAGIRIAFIKIHKDRSSPLFRHYKGDVWALLPHFEGEVGLAGAKLPATVNNIRVYGSELSFLRGAKDNNDVGVGEDVWPVTDSKAHVFLAQTVGTVAKEKGLGEGSSHHVVADEGSRVLAPATLKAAKADDGATELSYIIHDIRPIYHLSKSGELGFDVSDEVKRQNPCSKSYLYLMIGRHRGSLLLPKRNKYVVGVVQTQTTAEGDRVPRVGDGLAVTLAEGPGLIYTGNSAEDSEVTLHLASNMEWMTRGV